MSKNQTEIVNLDMLVPEKHPYKQFFKIFDPTQINQELKKIEKNRIGRFGYGIERLFRALLYQFMEDLSDRELEESLRLNLVCKWFCNFGISEKTPDYSLFTKIRNKIGTKKLSQLFNIMKDQLREKGYMSEMFSFVDSSHLISKASLWQERDKAIKAKYDKLNNSTLSKIARDKDAKIGCKGKDKFWYGFKKHVSCDMESGMINKVAVTSANINDAKGLKNICPNNGTIYGDKGYCTAPAQNTAKKKKVNLAAIKMNNMKDKNPEKDKYYSKLRAPFERIFSQCNKKARYIGISKNQFAEFMWAICFNLKRMLILSLNHQTNRVNYV